MKFTFYHNNINVADLDKSIEFYKKALGLKIKRDQKLPTEASSWYSWVMTPPAQIRAHMAAIWTDLMISRQ